MVSDIETDSYALRGIPSDKQKEVLDALEKVGELMYVRAEDGEIRFGVDENKQDQIYSYEFDDDFDDDSYSFFAGEVTKKVQETVGNILGRRIRAHFVEETASMGELIWGENWEEDVALTEDEREMLS
ncbi:hypothetical protein A3J56_01905 [Candidatus Giovannonibacteria bacterium RIFCSPHIGHO2_02_FULL_46_20]|uniref:Uncharacterized protein n=1 Tax=Candidatus Giovannonibacteria bacterium RIFCSPHIGHO2_02_FULL_46_20 TaxID=1798338 RepID=A0A1F5WDJ8_9BACT|nr:MAG: hypothetical protein A3J56_01905 [Candidatus Giovannonibacteria bacterium RIFCSPHIGHO2_02_FULL_46_20]